MKLTVIGGGGVRSMFLAKSIAQRAKDLHITELVFMDNDPEKLRIYGGMAAQVSRRVNPELSFRLTGDPEDAVRDADYIITTIRVGGDGMRVKDERIALSRGVLGQETTGAAGFSFAMRSVPALAEYCELAKKVAHPNVKIFNFTNPAGVVSQALRDMGYDFTYGICDAPTGMLREFAALYGADSSRITGECYGLNHLSWFRNAKVNGRDVQRELLDNPRTYEHSEMRLFTREMARISGDCMLNEYLYFYYRRVKSLSMIQKADHPRGEMIYLINRELEEQLARLELPRDFEQAFSLYMTAYGKRENAYFSVESGACREKVWNPPTVEEFLTAPDEGGYAAVALRFIRAITDGENCRMVLSVPNNGAIDGLRDDDVVEITCDIRSDGAHPVRIGAIDEFQLQQIKRLKYFERCTIQAILEDDRDAAVKGLALHPLVNDFELAETLTDIFFDKDAEFIHMNETP